MSRIHCASSESLGFYVVASERINAGEIFFRETAYVCCPNNFSEKKKYCIFCCAPIPGNVQISCERCKSPYCSANCLEEHNSHHNSTGECAATLLTLMAKNQIPQEDLDTFVIVTLIIAACVSEGEEDFLKFNVNQNLVRETIGLGNETTTPDSFLNTGDHTQTRRATFDELLCLATNVSGTDPEIIKDFSKLYRIYKKTLNSKKAEEIRHFFSTDVTIEVFTGIACAYMCNGFGVWSPTNKKHGTAVYPLSSYFNHSCAPNTGRRLIKGTRTLEFFTTRDVEPGESLCFSYIDIKRPAKERVEKLKATYSFVCQCTRCSLPGDEADSVCNGYVPPLCNFCISKVMQPLKDGKYICPCCDTIQMPE